jgi:hypothetical protein
MVTEEGSRAADAIIVIEPIRQSTHTTTEEMEAATRNNGSGFREWAAEEGAWILAQLAKTAISVAVFRVVHQLFRAKITSESVYRRAADLWTHGHDRRGDTGRAPYGGATRWQQGADQGGNSVPRPDNTQQDHQGRTAPENPRYITTVDGHHLYLHRKVLDPERQYWPCPILWRTPCGNCRFLEYDSGGMPQCVALWKLKAILEGEDGGEDLDEVRESIRNS